jgi:hypothetical protein
MFGKDVASRSEWTVRDIKHFEMAKWIDFTRGLLPGEQAGQMREHAGECSGCMQMVQYHERLGGVVREMTRISVPDEVVARARAIFPAPCQEPKRLVRIMAQLIYDSFLAPAPVGLRSTWQVGWQALFRAGDCSLDLRIEPELRSLRAAVIGQISNHESPESRMSDIQVCLKSGRLVVAETRSNEFGEFQMEYEQQNRLQLWVYLDSDRYIQVPLKRFMPEKPAGTEGLNLQPVASRKRPVREGKL